MRRFIKSDILQDATDEQLVKIKVADQNIHVNHKRVDVGFASEKLKGAKNEQNRFFDLYRCQVHIYRHWLLNSFFAGWPSAFLLLLIGHHLLHLQELLLLVLLPCKNF